MAQDSKDTSKTVAEPDSGKKTEETAKSAPADKSLDDILSEIGGIVLGERAADTEGVHDFHGLSIFDLVLARNGYSSAGEERVAQDHRGQIGRAHV